jgi:iron complex transport system ATP-binding protein
MTGRLTAEHLWLGYHHTPAVQDISLELTPGAMVALIGPNGSGKSTLLKGFARLMGPQYGAVLLDGQVLHTFPSREVARRLAILPQDPDCPADFTVRELVALGRWPHRRRWQMHLPPRDPAVQWALTVTGLLAFAPRPLATLSGGERQRAWVAMALAQTSTILLLDEPTTYLDIGYQWEIMELLEDLNRRHGVTILMALHDIQHAAWFSHRLVVMQKGRLVTQGAPAEVLTAALMADVFGVKARIYQDEEIGRLLCIPLGRQSKVEGRGCRRRGDEFSGSP